MKSQRSIPTTTMFSAALAACLGWAAGSVQAAVIAFDDLDGGETGFATGSDWGNYSIVADMGSGNNLKTVNYVPDDTWREMSSSADLTGDQDYYCSILYRGATDQYGGVKVASAGNDGAGPQVMFRNSGGLRIYHDNGGGWLTVPDFATFDSASTYLLVVKLNASTTVSDAIQVMLYDLTAGDEPDETEPTVWTASADTTFTRAIRHLALRGEQLGATSFDNIQFTDAWSDLGFTPTDPPPPPPAADYYVAPDGSNGNAGTSNAPFATIQHAANQAGPGDTIAIAGGVYRETVTVPVSGTAAQPITFLGYPGQDVVVSACDTVANWTVHSGSIWKANVPWDVGTDGVGNTLFVGGTLMFEAREGAESDPMDLDNWGRIDQGDMTSTYFEADDIKGWGNDFWNGAKIRCHVNDWSLATRTVQDYNSSLGRVTFDSSVGTVSQKHRFGYTIYDTLKALNQAGEWFKDRGTDILYYQVSPGQDPNDLDIEFKSRTYALDVRGRDHIHIAGLTFRGAAIRTDGNTDYNVYSNNTFCAYTKGDVGRFNLQGTYNTFRDNEVSQVWGGALSVNGTRHDVINNYFHDIGYDGTARVVGMSGSEHLVSHNTVHRFARSFLDGYPYRSEFAYNLFEDGANLSWDTGVFDGDAGRGNGGGCIVHHNVFRNSDPIGIYMAFYAGLELVIHHNVIYDMTPYTLRIGQLQFGKYYHNTVIGPAPIGDAAAESYAFESAYNNNLQVSLGDAASLGVDFRGNVNYQESDFVNFGADDYRLAVGSAAIDAGIVLPEINDGYAGAAPDAGALEYGENLWTVGHNFTTPPNPVFAWTQLPGSNLFDNNTFSRSPTGWSYARTPVWFYGNAWNTFNRGLSRSGGYCMQLESGDGMLRTFAGLKSNTWYAVAVEARLADQRIEMEHYDAISGSVTSSSHRNEDYVTGLSEGEWLAYTGVDFGTDGKYNLLELTYSRPPGTARVATSATLDLRLGSASGPLVGTFMYDDTVEDAWYVSRISVPPLTGLQDLYFVGQGADAGVMMLASVRLLNDNIPPDERLSVSAQNTGGPDVTARCGYATWQPFGYEVFRFRTGPASDSFQLLIYNQGRYDAYLDRLAIFESEQPGTDAAFGQPATLSTTLPGSDAALAVDGDLGTTARSENQPDSWWTVDLGGTRRVYGIRLTAPQDVPGQLSDIRVSVWDTRPGYGMKPLWQRDYLGNGSLAAGETLVLKATEDSADGEAALQTIAGRYVRVELPGQNNLGNGTLGLADLQVISHDETDKAASDGTIEQGVDYWQASFAARINVGEIELRNADDASYLGLSNFKVSVWDRDPDEDGSIVWQQDYFTTGSVGQGASFLVRGDDLSTDGVTRLASTLGRVVRVELNGLNAAGNNHLTLQQGVVRNGQDVPPAKNAALHGTATQSSNWYTGHKLAGDVINRIIQPAGDFNATVRASDAWWQVELVPPVNVDQVVIWCRDATGNFRVSLWDDDPVGGGSELWGKNYDHGSDGISDETALVINGNVTSGGTRLDQVVGARFLRVQMLEYDFFSLSEVQVWDQGFSAPVEQYTGRIEAEDYDTGGEGAGYHDTTAGNTGGQYRNDDVDIAAGDGGMVVGWVEEGEWLAHTADLHPGTYDFSTRVAAPGSGRTITATFGDHALGTFAMPNTGSYNTYQTVTVTNVVVVTGGVQRLVLDLAGGGMNLNWVDFTLVGDDGDTDGLRDDWEVIHFGDLSPEPQQDPDRDRFDNLEEYIACTLPADSNSFFRVESLESVDGVGQTLTWDACRERVYDVHRAESLEGGFLPLQTDLVQGTYTDTSGTNLGFYRVNVRMPL